MFRFNLFYLFRQIIFSNKMSSRVCEMCEAYEALRESQLQKHIQDIDMTNMVLNLRSLKKENDQLICEPEILLTNKLFYFAYIFLFLAVTIFLIKIK